jgi:hypothetical protein
MRSKTVQQWQHSLYRIPQIFVNTCSIEVTLLQLCTYTAIFDNIESQQRRPYIQHLALGFCTPAASHCQTPGIYKHILKSFPAFSCLPRTFSFCIELSALSVNIYEGWPPPSFQPVSCSSSRYIWQQPQLLTSIYLTFFELIRWNDMQMYCLRIIIFSNLYNKKSFLV